MARRLCHAAGEVLPGCARHMLSGSWVPVQRVTTSAPRSGARAMTLRQAPVAAARARSSGSMALYVPDRPQIRTPAAVKAPLIWRAWRAVRVVSSVARPRAAKLSWVAVNPAARMAAATPEQPGREDAGEDPQFSHGFTQEPSLATDSATASMSLTAARPSWASGVAAAPVVTAAANASICSS